MKRQSLIVKTAHILQASETQLRVNAFAETVRRVLSHYSFGIFLRDDGGVAVGSAAAGAEHDSHSLAIADSDSFFRANAGRFETATTSGLGQRLRLSASSASGEQYWAALEWIGSSD